MNENKVETVSLSLFHTVSALLPFIFGSFHSMASTLHRMQTEDHCSVNRKTESDTVTVIIILYDCEAVKISKHDVICMLPP